jgi:DNA-binding transcriptional MerR regulator
VGDVAQRHGVTVRTLHHYDEIGLLQPSGRSASGYRHYTAEDEERLRAILAFRAAGVPLREIPALLVGDRGAVLAEQLAAIDGRLETLRIQRHLLSSMKEAHDMGIDLTPDEYAEVFGDGDPAQYAQEVDERWGDTDAYRESRRRTSAYRAEDWAAARADAQAVVDEFRACQEEGVPPDSPRAAAAVVAHRESISRWYYECSADLQMSLAEMYVADPRFRAHYDDQQPGLAEYIRDAILAAATR